MIHDFGCLCVHYLGQSLPVVLPTPALRRDLHFHRTHGESRWTTSPDIYLRELQADLKSELGVEVSLWTICKACQAVKRTRKKRH